MTRAILALIGVVLAFAACRAEPPPLFDPNWQSRSTTPGYILAMPAPEFQAQLDRIEEMLKRLPRNALDVDALPECSEWTLGLCKVTPRGEKP